MKKVFTIETKDNEKVGFQTMFVWNIFAENINSAVDKIKKYKADKHTIISAKLLCKVEEDLDLKRYLEE